MAVSGPVRLGLWGGVPLILAVLAASLSATPVLAADQPAQDQVASLEKLSATIGNLKTNLAAIRKDLEGIRSMPQTAAGSPPEPACAPAANIAGEPELAPGELVQLRNERAALKDRVTELEKTIEKARTTETGDGLVKNASAAPIGTAAAADANAREQDNSAKATEPGSAAPADAGTGDSSQLRADLASAQLRIAELSDELRSTRANKAALEAELSSLRSLTDDKIKQFMGWQ
jgi:cell division protein FtsB